MEAYEQKIGMVAAMIQSKFDALTFNGKGDFIFYFECLCDYQSNLTIRNLPAV
jgi:ketol-acid reductoisomerase